MATRSKGPKVEGTYMSSLYRTQRVNVTPELATQWLETQEGNRPIKQSVVEKYAMSMRDGEWAETGETIKFDIHEHLIDGQHRLFAVMEAELIIPFEVVWGLPTSARDRMDTGSIRSGSDVLGMHGVSYPRAVFPALGILKSYLAGQLPSIYYSGHHRISNAEAYDMFLRYPGIEHSATVTANIPMLRRLIPRSYAAFLHYIFAQTSAEANGTFWAKLVSGADLGRDDAVLHLRERLIANKSAMGRSKLDITTFLALSIKAWNGFRRGKPVYRIQYSPTKEQFPRAI